MHLVFTIILIDYRYIYYSSIGNLFRTILSSRRSLFILEYPLINAPYIASATIRDNNNRQRKQNGGIVIIANRIYKERK